MARVCCKVVAGVVALLMLVAAFPGIVPASEVIWDSSYMRVHFEWLGYWDKVAYWAYGMWVFDVYDWAYLYGWYGLGWNALTSIYGSPPTGKIDMYFYNDPNDPASGWGGNMQIRINLAHMADLDTSSSYWVQQVLREGAVLAHEASHNIFFAWTNNSNLGDFNFATESMAYYISSCLWPWYNLSGAWNTGTWTPQYTESTIGSNYRSWVNTSGSGGLLTCYDAGYEYWNTLYYGWELDAKYHNSWWMLNAAGVFLAKLDSDGILNNGYLLNYIKAGYSVSNAFSAIWGVTWNLNANSTTNNGDWYYYFYNYWWT